MSEELSAIRREYEELSHAMQSGVAMMMNYDPGATTPKHLRVGVNSAMVDSGALAGQLEYYTALRDGLKREVESYTKLIRERLGGAEVNLR